MSPSAEDREWAESAELRGPSFAEPEHPGPRPVVVGDVLAHDRAGGRLAASAGPIHSEGA